MASIELGGLKSCRCAHARSASTAHTRQSGFNARPLEMCKGLQSIFRRMERVGFEPLKGQGRVDDHNGAVVTLPRQSRECTLNFGLNVAAGKSAINPIEAPRKQAGRRTAQIRALFAQHHL